MVGKGLKILVSLFLTIELYQCMASPSIQSESGVPNSGDFTYQASLRTYWAYHYCAGAIISDRWVLTSATCIVYNHFEITEKFVVLGGIDIFEGDSYPCDLVKKHELFQLGQFDYDIALVRTSSSIQFSQFIQPIPYYKGSIESDINDAVSIGWGSVWNYEGIAQPLTYTRVTVRPTTRCEPIRRDFSAPFFPSTVICGLYPSLRDVDFGVPLATLDSRILLGIYAGYSNDGIDRPDLYTGTADLADWIFQNSNVDGIVNVPCRCSL